MKRKLLTTSLFLITALFLNTNPVEAKITINYRRKPPITPTITPSFQHQPTRSVPKRNQPKPCHQIMDSIQLRSQNILNYANRHLLVLDKVYNNLKKFIAKKAIADKYKSVILEIEANRQEVVLTAESAKDAFSKISCDNSNPRNTIQTFNNQMMSFKKTLKSYQNSIIKLITTLKVEYNNSKSDDKDK